VYSLLGLVLFLIGVEVGFIPAGSLFGGKLAGSVYKWLLIPVGMLIGYFIVSAEPAAHGLNSQVEEISGGAIPQKAMKLCLSLGVSVSVGLSMVRVLTGISIFWFLIPGYAISLLLTLTVPKIFTGIAFDSGSVASGGRLEAPGRLCRQPGRRMLCPFRLFSGAAFSPPQQVPQIVAILANRENKQAIMDAINTSFGLHKPEAWGCFVGASGGGGWIELVF